MSIREMVRRAALEERGLGVSTATRPDAPVEPTWAKGSLPPGRAERAPRRTKRTVPVWWGSFPFLKAQYSNAPRIAGPGRAIAATRACLDRRLKKGRRPRAAFEGVQLSGNYSIDQTEGLRYAGRNQKTKAGRCVNTPGPNDKDPIRDDCETPMHLHL